MTMPCPPNPPPPAGTSYWPAKVRVSPEILAWSRGNLKYVKGTLIVDNVGGQDVVARLETHYHEPNGPIQPWGCHKGNTIYYPTTPIDPSTYGVYPPPGSGTGGAGAIDSSGDPGDPFVLAGPDYYDSSNPGAADFVASPNPDTPPPIASTNWWLVGLCAGTIALVVGGTLLALKVTGHAALNR